MEGSSMNNSKAIASPIFSGLMLGLIGEYLMGFASAIAIPTEYFLWFKENIFADLGLIILSIAQNFMVFGLLALITGYLLSKLTPTHWLTNSIICYLSVLLYFSVGSALVYGGAISNPFAGLSNLYFLPTLVLPACLLASTYMASTKHNKTY